jgi:predicted MFS family arabinose efflux permease
VVANRALRTFGYGLTSVVLLIYLALLGAPPVALGLAVALSLGSGAALNVLVVYFGDRFGRRRAMAVFGGLMAVAGAVLAVAPNYGVAMVGLALGAVSPTGTEVGPFLSLEQSVVADVTPAGGVTRAFAWYNLVGSFAAAAGALAASYPVLVFGSALPSAPGPFRFAFAAYAGLGIAAAVIGRTLPAGVELGDRGRPPPLGEESRRRVGRLASLFAADSFAGGLVVQTFVAFWFARTYPAASGYLGVVFFGAGVLSAVSFLVAARLGERIGLLPTMVFTHLPSNVLLALVPLAPSFAGALALYLARMALSQMDVPTRQAYLVGIVARSERSAANASTNTARNVAQALGGLGTSALVALVGLASPFFFGGAIKIGYDLSVFALFRRIRPDAV